MKSIISSCLSLLKHYIIKYFMHNNYISHTSGFIIPGAKKEEVQDFG